MPYGTVLKFFLCSSCCIPGDNCLICRCSFVNQSILDVDFIVLNDIIEVTCDQAYFSLDRTV